MFLGCNGIYKNIIGKVLFEPQKIDSFIGIWIQFLKGQRRMISVCGHRLYHGYLWSHITGQSWSPIFLPHFRSRQMLLSWAPGMISIPKAWWLCIVFHKDFLPFYSVLEPSLLYFLPILHLSVYPSLADCWCPVGWRIVRFTYWSNISSHNLTNSRFWLALLIFAPCHVSI